MLTAFIGEEKWKFEKARQLKKAQYKKECFLKKDVVKMTTDELVRAQAEIKGLNDEFQAYHADCLGAKVRFVKMAGTFTSNVVASSQHESPQAVASAQPTEEHVSTTDDYQAANESESTRVDEAIPAADEIARATTSVAREEIARPAEASVAAPEQTEQTRATASLAPEENEPISSAPPAATPIPILHSASEAKKTKATERAAVKKRKASAPSESSAPKKTKTLTSSFENPIDAIHVSSMPSMEIIPFEIPATSADAHAAEEAEIQAATENVDTEIPQPAAPDTVIPKTVKDAPFMLVSTCIYLEDTKFGHPWKLVVPIGSRGTYDVPENFDGQQDAAVQAYQEDAHSSPHRFVADVEDEVEDHEAAGDVEEEEEEEDVVPNVHRKRDEALGVSVPASVVEEICRKFEQGKDDYDMSEDELVDEEEIHPDEMNIDLD
nr:uncharacterized protein LOC120963254 [Aegilops tauschii subsp. strangulata]